MNNKIDPCDTMRVSLIAAAVGHQQCTKTGACVIPLPGTDRVIAIGAPAEVERLLGAHAPATAKLTPERIEELYAPFMHELPARAALRDFARAIEREVLGAHAGVVANDTVSTLDRWKGHEIMNDPSLDCVEFVRLDEALAILAAPAAQAPVPNAEEVRRAALEEAAKAAENTDVATVTWQSQVCDDGYETRDRIAKAIRALATKEESAEAPSDTARDAALTAARAWIVEHRPALTLSRQATIDSYMAVLDQIDAAMSHGAQREKGGE